MKGELYTWDDNDNIVLKDNNLDRESERMEEIDNKIEFDEVNRKNRE